jgi:hypothetical protein
VFDEVIEVLLTIEDNAQLVTIIENGTVRAVNEGY